MKNFEDKTVGEIVAEDHRTAFVFKSFGIDFCCGGKKNVGEACNSKNVDPKSVEKKIKEVMGRTENNKNFKDRSPAFLVDYIVNNHHSYVKNTLPHLVEISAKVARVHGRSNPELNEMYKLVRELDTEMISHMHKEENILFPMIKKLGKGSSNERNYSILLEELEDEHEEAGELMSRLEAMSNNFTPPEGACTSYVIYFKTLKEFRDDLHMHVHLENNVLFPKVIDEISESAK